MARKSIHELEAELHQLEGDLDEAANERDFTKCAKLNREAAIVRASISERQEVRRKYADRIETGEGGVPRSS